MRFLRLLTKGLQTLVSGALLASMAACASEPRLVDHSFGFDARRDSPDVEILDYRYGSSNFPGVRGCPKHYSRCDTIPQGANTNGEMPLGNEIYVKWRIKSTGEVYEDSVNLRGRLPVNMYRQRIRFVVSGLQLYIFLISPEKLNPNPCPSREELRRLKASQSAYDKVFSYYCDLKIEQVYPD